MYRKGTSIRQAPVFGTSEDYRKAQGSLLSGWMNYNYTACCWFPTSSNMLILPSQFWQIRFESCWLHCSKCWILVLLRYMYVILVSGAKVNELCGQVNHIWLICRTATDTGRFCWQVTFNNQMQRVSNLQQKTGTCTYMYTCTRLGYFIFSFVSSHNQAAWPCASAFSINWHCALQNVYSSV